MNPTTTSNCTPRKLTTIGIAGRAGSGKDTLADVLIIVLTTIAPWLRTIRDSYAAPIRRYCEAVLVLGLTRDNKEQVVQWAHSPQDEDLLLQRCYKCAKLLAPYSSGADVIQQWVMARLAWWLDSKHYKFSPREFMQFVGCDIRDEVSRDYWVDFLNARVTDAAQYTDDHHEATLVFVTDCRFQNEVDKLDGVIYITRPETNTGGVVTPGHVSETPLFDIGNMPPKAVHFINDENLRYLWTAGAATAACIANKILTNYKPGVKYPFDMHWS